MRGPAYAVASATLAQLTALLMGLVLLISGAIVGLVTLRYGYRRGLQVATFATITTVTARLAWDGQWFPMLLICIVTWVPAVGLCDLLRQPHEQGLASTGAAIRALTYGIGVRLFTGDVDQFWVDRLAPLLEQFRGDSGLVFSEADIGLIAGQVHTWTLIAIFLFFAMGSLLARWWQAEIYNPNGFGEEFRKLSVPRPILYIALMIALGVVFLSSDRVGSGIVGDAFVVIVLLFAFQGLALAHYRVHVANMSAGWLTTLYIFLVLLPQFAGPILAAVGIAYLSANFRSIKSKSNKEA